MHTELEKTLDAVFAGFDGPPYLNALKLEMAATLEERLASLRKVGVIEEAALKKVRGDFEKSIKLAQSSSGGDKKKELAQLARSLGLNTLGRRMALIRTVSGISAAFGMLAAAIVLVTGGTAAGAAGAFAPFAAASAAGLTYIAVKTRWNTPKS